MGVGGESSLGKGLDLVLNVDDGQYGLGHLVHVYAELRVRRRVPLFVGAAFCQFGHC